MGSAFGVREGDTIEGVRGESLRGEKLREGESESSREGMIMGLIGARGPGDEAAGWLGMRGETILGETMRGPRWPLEVMRPGEGAPESAGRALRGTAIEFGLGAEFGRGDTTVGMVTLRRASASALGVCEMTGTSIDGVMVGIGRRVTFGIGVDDVDGVMVRKGTFCGATLLCGWSAGAIGRVLMSALDGVVVKARGAREGIGDSVSFGRASGFVLGVSEETLGPETPRRPRSRESMTWRGLFGAAAGVFDGLRSAFTAGAIARRGVFGVSTLVPASGVVCGFASGRPNNSGSPERVRAGIAGRMAEGLRGAVSAREPLISGVSIVSPTRLVWSAIVVGRWSLATSGISLRGGLASP